MRDLASLVGSTATLIITLSIDSGSSGSTHVEAFVGLLKKHFLTPLNTLVKELYRMLVSLSLGWRFLLLTSVAKASKVGSTRFFT